MRLLEGEYAVRVVNLPGDVLGCVKLTRDGSEFPNIYINDQLSPYAKREAFAHEMNHLEHDDFYNQRTIEEAEDQ